jgi:cytochrome c
VKTGISLAVLIGVVGLAQSGAWAQAESSTRDGIYSEAQAVRGEASYKKACASCHGEKMEGQGQMPGLAGDEFAQMWAGKTLDEIFDRIQNSMPGDKPGTLSRSENSDIVAFILKANKLPAGQKDLSGDAEPLKKIKIELAK